MPNPIVEFARKAQHIEKAVPSALRLPLRFQVQRMLGALEPEIALLPGLLEPSRGIALDVGANVGIYTYALARLGATVHAFEPQVACSDTIAAWAERRDDVTLHRAGVGASAGELILYVPLVRGAPVRTRASFQPLAGEQVQLRVPVIALDGMQLPSVAFMKIDVEGFELEVLQGARALLGRDRPTLLVEIDRQRQTAESFASIIELLAEFGYRAHVLSEGRLLDCSPEPWQAPAQAYNFIFPAPGATR
ncbi:MAG TPA: FkbM family methyltransferase [Luteimonas sp.]|nr:FkbM family methyltransferase [Luteimonas sp.]